MKSDDKLIRVMKTTVDLSPDFHEVTVVFKANYKIDGRELTLAMEALLHDLFMAEREKQFSKVH